MNFGQFIMAFFMYVLSVACCVGGWWLLYNDKAKDHWGWFLFVGFLFFMTTSVCSFPEKAKKIAEELP